MKKKNLLELIDSAKLQDKKINTQKSAMFLYTNSEQSEKEIEKTISFIIA